MDNAGPDGAILKISLAVVILQRWSREVCTVLLERGLFLKNQITLPKKCSVRPSSRLKTVDLNYRSSLSVARLVRFWFKIWPPTTDSSYKVTYFFWLCVRTRCLSICAPSFVAVVWCKWALRVSRFEHGTCPKLYPITLNNTKWNG